ncbi:hypothetical protein Bhyg_00793 [Pseudolycoriella hygida]|uniref:Uncharacterized protein n=1 Tax=Pseudolycoriella hygida TaxID=35572 RepID=A0A9Q0N878_9DIPT|nr:hypothetical protein Bhyg_00793 [Pseudolycoriella hygida]
MEECGQDELAACARPLQVLTETSELSFVTKKSELDKLCPDLHAGLQCIRSYTRRCMNMQQRTHFNKLVDEDEDGNIAVILIIQSETYVSHEVTIRIVTPVFQKLALFVKEFIYFK